MVENSPEGLVVLAGEVPVTVTREERHQPALARYAVAPGRQRHVVVELAWCTIDAGKHRGQRAIEVRLDGQRIGELTHLMSQRYAPLVARIAGDGGRPGCEAVVQRGARGLEVVLRLPRDPEGAVAAPVAATAARGSGPATNRRPLWIGGAVVGAVLLIGAIANSGDSDEPTTPAADQRTTTVAPPTTTTTTTTTPPPPPPTTTTVVPAPVATQPVVPQTTEAPPPPPPPPAEPACDPNYTGCVPIADDVDCAGGSGNGPEYVAGPVQVIGTDIYDLDRDGDGTACDS